MKETKTATAKSLVKLASGFSFGVLVSRIMGLVREIIYATLFGASAGMDAFRTAYIIPGLILEFISEGTMNAAFIPVFSDLHKSKGKQCALSFALNLFNILLVLSFILMILLILFAPGIVKILAGGYSFEKQMLTVKLVRMLFPILVLSSLISLVMGILNYYRHYPITGLAPAMWNLVTIGITWLGFNFYRSRGLETSYALGLGIVLGAVAEFLFMIPTLYREGFRYRWTFNLNSPHLKKVLILFIPVALGYVATRINVAINQAVATHMGEGSVSHYSYAFRLMSFPLGIIGVSLATVTLPEAARYASSRRTDLVCSILIKTLRLAMFFVFPVCCLMWLLRFHIVRIIFQHRAFLPGDTVATGAILGWFLIGIIGASSTKIMANIFFSLKDTKSPVIISFISSIINIIAIFLLTRLMGINGLSLAVSIASIFGAVLLVLTFHVKFSPLPFKLLWEGLFKVIVATLLPVIIYIPWLQLFEPSELKLIQSLLIVVVVSATYLPFYLILARLLNFKVSHPEK
ncbi:MAG: murein biosynthesis integral membrane protein MurJ [bacterium]